MTGFTHGSSGYQHHRCRCAVCLAWNRERARRYYQRHVHGLGAPSCYVVERDEIDSMTEVKGRCGIVRWVRG